MNAFDNFRHDRHFFVVQRGLAERDFELVRRQEQQAWPRARAAALDRQFGSFTEWTAAERNVSVVFETADAAGFVMAVPLSPLGWQRLLGATDSVELDFLGEQLWTPSVERRAGIYVYMVKKPPSSSAGFTERAYKAVFRRCLDLRTDMLPLGLAGCSVSNSSIHIALQKQGRSPICSLPDYIFEAADGRLAAAEVFTQSDLDSWLDRGYRIKNRAVLSALTFDQPSIVWRWWREAGGCG